MNTQKNSTLELLKLFASYMVVFIHVLFYGQAGIVFDALARFAVPLFFLISGFYSYQITTKKIRKRILNTFALLIFATLSYTAFNILTYILNNNAGEIIYYFRLYKNVDNLVKLLVFNIPISAFHLWYLYALLYVYIIFYILTALRLNERVIFIISFLLLLLQVLLGEVLSAVGIVLPTPFVRNFVVTGIPFFGMGLIAKKYEKQLCTVPDSVIVLSAVTGVFAAVFSRYAFGKNELYIGSLFILFSIVCVFIKYSTVQYPSFITALEGCSTYIYIFHIMILSVLNKIYAAYAIDINASIILKNLHPIVVCISSTLIAHFLTKVFQKARKKKNIAPVS